MQIIDAHTHFFSYTWFEQFYHLAEGRYGSVNEIAAKLTWELPGNDPVDLGKRWVAEQDKFGLSRQVLFASKLNDAEFLAAAVNAFPKRLIGYFMINPGQKDARNQTLYSLNILGMQGVLLFPAMHHFFVFDDSAYTIYEQALSASVPVFIHMGQLNIPVFAKLGLTANIDLKYSNPKDLKQVVRDFPELNFILPHFGCGMFEEALALAQDNVNVYFDTSSSNSWIEPPLTLADVFKKSLAVLGPERLLFGTDSSFFPRGWRKDIFEQQKSILELLNIPGKEKDLIFGGNISRLLEL